jgi:23S rRNA-/tRNA-specific pseudouridylate synthase
VKIACRGWGEARTRGPFRCGLADAFHALEDLIITQVGLEATELAKQHLRSKSWGLARARAWMADKSAVGGLRPAGIALAFYLDMLTRRSNSKVEPSHADRPTQPLDPQANAGRPVPTESGTFAVSRPVDVAPLALERVRGRPSTVVVLGPAVVYQDHEIIVVDKSHREATTPECQHPGSLLARLSRLPGTENAVAVHSLDMGTSGLVMFVRRPELVAKWEGVMSAASTRTIYVAAVRGITPEKGAITRDLRDGDHVSTARTRYRRLAIAAGQSVLRVVPDQGHSHQIRRHFAAIGHPVLGDDRYGNSIANRSVQQNSGLDRVFLHCIRLEFDHPDTGKRHIVEAPIPGDLRAVLERMSGADTVRFLDHKNALGLSTFPPVLGEGVHFATTPAVDVVLPEPTRDRS